MENDRFYAAFEAEHRGDRELIKNRLSQYLPFVAPFLATGDDEPIKALDLGCGRGEWLEVMSDQGVDAAGVDLDEGMLTDCRDHGLNAKQADACDYISRQPDESLHVVTGFHFAEHIPFDALQAVMRESLRSLKSGGLLILETPNPENIVVGTTDFFLDPTHQTPLPPPLLEFAARFTGFARVRILRLQEGERLEDAERRSLFDVFAAVSPDYALVAQKAGPDSFLGLFDEAFEMHRGLTLRDIAHQYDALAERKFKELNELAGRQVEAMNAIEQLITTFDKERLNWQSDRERFLGELASAREKAEASEADRRHLKEELSSVRAELSATLDSLQRELGDTKASNQHLLKELGDTQSSNQHLLEEVASLNENKFRMEHDLAQSSAAVASLEAELLSVRQTAMRTMNEQIAAIHASKSWRITAPLRKAQDLILAISRWNKRGGGAGTHYNPNHARKKFRTVERSPTGQATPENTAGLASLSDASSVSDSDIDRFLDRICREIDRRDGS